MDVCVDYYAALGLLPSAEDSVVRAAYRALAQRYHPDRFAGSPEIANMRMAELNVAYAILSNPDNRRVYDAARRERARDAEEALRTEADDPRPPYDPLSSDWDIATRFYPDLQEIDKRLSRMSWRLSYSYRVVLLESKLFNEREILAAALESEFLSIYFGSDERVKSFARKLIQSGNKAGARRLNELVKVLGSNVDPLPIIQEVLREYPDPTPEVFSKALARQGISFDGEKWCYRGHRYSTFDEASCAAKAN